MTPGKQPPHSAFMWGD